VRERDEAIEQIDSHFESLEHKYKVEFDHVQKEVLAIEAVLKEAEQNEGDLQKMMDFIKFGGKFVPSSPTKSKTPMKLR